MSTDKYMAGQSATVQVEFMVTSRLIYQTIQGAANLNQNKILLLLRLTDDKSGNIVKAF